MKKYFLLTIFLFAIFLTACGEQETPVEENTDDAAAYPSDVEENPVVTITMENDEQIILELYPEIAPNTVANFISLIEEGFYDGVIFHRVIPGFMIQGGDPDGAGTGGPGYSIAGEFASNNFENDLEHDKGVLSMARSQSPDSAGSQFFIMVENSPHLDGDYAGFGKVTEGMEVVETIVSADRDEMDKPFEDQVMKTVEVDTKGYDYPEPNILSQ
ncbi:peptidylprolyl isomerase [Oceanobacillus alkalisoli]|uniref:peptidylprolyl isomerase n=1 Tax=Oceanobacillus alkalisoli TaxID=2925113 RepID=UPI001EF0553A|nr:peptidylprolyl isomerase [Oceanobacillus alkalisoli]MCF3944780.1 peptidylprolyl isomerase [Oceanobacillus alkalisoli]MCG5105260.1 peptidylprolyl isomerase [Oceanobacillus alkalisoli]